MVERYLEENSSSPREVERVALLDSLGRVLASPIVADRYLPPFARSTRDGFAVRANDLANLPAKLTVVGELRAGDPAERFLRVLAKGEAVEIMTGAAVPQGADAVVMVEYTRREGRSVAVERAAARGENIVARGSEAKAADALASAGTRIRHAEIALAASCGIAQFEVFKKLEVAILSTGDEIVGLDQPPAPHQIRNSNSYSLAAQVLRCGAQPKILPIAPDEPERLRELVAEGLKSDLLVLSGGVSMGKYDFVEGVLAGFGARFFFTGALIQPGRPIVFLDAMAPGEQRRVPVFGLPGNPVSTMVTFDLFVRPMLDALGGAKVKPLRFMSARLRDDIRTKTGLTRFLPAQFQGEQGQTTVELVRWQGSGDVVSVVRSNCYIVVPPDRESIPAGEYVSIFIPGAEL